MAITLGEVLGDGLCEGLLILGEETSVNGECESSINAMILCYFNLLRPQYIHLKVYFYYVMSSYINLLLGMPQQQQ